MKLAVAASHPVQYQSPLYRHLAADAGCELKVFYGYLPDAKRQGEGFGVPFEWDVPLLDGHQWECFGAGQGTPRMATLTRRFATAVRAFGPDVVLYTGWHHPSMVAALAAIPFLGLPAVLRCEANLAASRAGIGAAARFLTLQAFAKFAAIGQRNREFYLAHGISPERIGWCPYFCDAGRLGAQLAAAPPRCAGEATRFLFVGKLIDKKRPADLLHAAARTPGVQLRFAGAGPLESPLRGLAEELGVDARFDGFLNQSEITAAYAAADCLVLPSDAGETWGVVVNEAMVCGLPVIVSDQVGCAPDLVIPGETGLVYPCGDIEALADCLRGLRDDAAARTAMGRRAQAHVGINYSVEVAAEGLLACIRDLV